MKNKHTTIAGMEPWMFWLLLAAVLFALVGPEIAMAINIESTPTVKAQ